MQVGIRELKQRLSEYVARVRAGETLIITDRGNPVARLERLLPSGTPPEIEHLASTGRLIYKPPPRHLDAPFVMLPGERTSADYVAQQRR